MKRSRNTRSTAGALRSRAEQRVPTDIHVPSAHHEGVVPDTNRLLHELQVHQIELELQNEELRRARADAEAGRARYSDLYELAPVGYLSLNRDGVIQEMNLAGARMLGMDRLRLVGKRFTAMVATDELPALNDFLQSAFEGHTTRSHAVVLHPEGAPPVTVELVAAASEDGQVCRVTATDVTWRRQAEHERHELQLRLYQAQKLEAIGTLAGGIAHDFNNILTGLLGGLSLLDLELSESSQHHAAVSEMKALVERGAELTKQLLGFARRGKYDIRPSDLLRVVEKTSSMFCRTRKDITLRLEHEPKLQAVLMDHVQLEQVLLNIYVNAAQAMPAGGLLLVRAANAELTHEQAALHGAVAGRYLRLAIEDSGVGMDETTRARVFEPFFTTKGPGQGTGLGLASVYGIVKNHSGFVAVESELGRGTTVTLYLPTTERPIAQEVPPAVSLGRGEGTILIVDDEALLLNIQSRLLQKIGYEVLTASGGQQALELVREHGRRIALVILDMIMPDMSGRQTFEALRALAPRMKVLLCSGYSQDGQAQEMIERGCNGFIQKPFDIATLSTKLKELL